jgi:putative tricarboxylic transport membrane protein
MSTDWTPARALQLVAGTPLGGGLDRVARALASALGDTGRIRVPVEVLNVPGDGARRAWTHCIDGHAGDAHVVGISSPNLTTDYLVGVAGFEHARYTPIATLITEYIAFGVRNDSALGTGTDLLAALAAPGATVALSTALGNPNHVALARLVRAGGGDINAPAIRVFDTALDAVAEVMAGRADVCAVTAASVLTEFESGRMRVLGVSAPDRLGGVFAATPTWREQGADCIIGAWRGVTGPAGLSDAQVRFWAGLLEAAAGQPAWKARLARLHWSPLLKTGGALENYLAAERAEFIPVLDELGLLKAPTP